MTLLIVSVALLAGCSTADSDPEKITRSDRVIEWFSDNAWIVWVVAGAAVGAAPGRKKRQVLSGLIWGAFLGPIGWLVLLALPDRGPKCPECLAPIDPSARKCRHCGSDLMCHGKINP